MNKFKYGVMTLALSGALSACTTTQEPPNALVTEARYDIKSAEELGAEKYAPLALRSARNNLNAAQNAMTQENYQQATYLLEKALADAEYATVKTNAEKSQTAAEQVEQNLDALRQAL